MKPNDTIAMQRSGTLEPIQTIAMQFDPKSIAHIMSVLTDLYSDPVLAVIREYSTNALDAHIEAGQTRPIEITTPGPLAPYYRVKDYGIGLATDDIVNIYSQYGASTKRETNEQVGMLGLGCKSALTYTNQFTVTGVKNGVKTIVNVGRNADGTGVMEIVDTVSTTEPNGVEVVIPSKDSYAFERRAADFFRFWKPGTVLVNGKQPALPKHTTLTTNVMRNGVNIAERVLMVDGLEQDYVVMGNVAYVVKERALYTDYRNYNHKFGIVAYVNIGTVNFTPSREALHYTPHTNETLVAIRTAVKAAIVKSAQDDVNAAPSHGEAVRRRDTWQKRFTNLGVLKYKGLDVPDRFTVSVLQWDTKTSRHAVQNERTVYLSSLLDDDVAVCLGFVGQSLSSRNKEKARIWMQENDVNYKRIYFVSTAFGQPWTDDVDVISWQDIASIKIHNPNAKGRVKREQPYDVMVSNGGYFQQTDTIDTSTEILYFSPAEKFDTNELRRAFKDATLVSIGMNRWDKFKRDFPTAKHVKDVALARYEAAKAALTDTDIIYLSAQYYEREAWSGLDAAKIDDPEVKDFMAAMTTGAASPRIPVYDNLFYFCRSLMLPVTRRAGVKVTTHTNKYPLVQNGSKSSHRDHIYLYMNAVYAAKKENN